MNKIFLLTAVFLVTITLTSCSKKSHPSKSPSITVISENTVPEVKKNTVPEVKKNDSTVIRKVVVKPARKETIPQVIVVNDSAAHKSVDGRYYYDVMGHRYWRNNKDGKYYLFNKSMYKNDDFKKQDQ